VRELSIFIDESGDFGLYDYKSPYYIISFVFHDQASSISKNINHLNSLMQNADIAGYTVHAGPLIRREAEYRNLSLLERKRIFNFLYNFARTSDITYHPFIIEKKQVVNNDDLTIKITKQLSSFLFENMQTYTQYERIVVYYDYGQRELTTILLTVFNTVLNNVEFRKVAPADYKLFQAADMLCTLELLALKCEHNALSNSELKFFKSAKDIYKSYIRAIRRKRI